MQEIKIRFAMLFGTLSPLQIIWLEQLTLEKHYPISAILQDIRTCTVKSVDKVSSDIRWYPTHPSTNFVAKWSYFIKNTFLRSFLPLKNTIYVNSFNALKISNCACPKHDRNLPVIFPAKIFLSNTTIKLRAPHVKEVNLRTVFAAKIFSSNHND